MTAYPNPDPNDQFDVERFRMPVSGRHSQKTATRVIKGEFIKSVPLKWLSPAMAQSGKVLATALAIWFEYGRKKAIPFKLTTAVLRRFSVSRKASYRALETLEECSLIDVRRAPGKNPIITVKISDH